MKAIKVNPSGISKIFATTDKLVVTIMTKEGGTITMDLEHDKQAIAYLNSFITNILDYLGSKEI